MVSPALAKKLSAQYVAGEETRADGDRWITMSNALVRAGHGLTLAEKRVVFIAISKLDSIRTPQPGESPSIRVTAAEYAALAGCEMPTAYEGLRDASKALYDRSITFFEPVYKRGGKPFTVKTTMRWVGSAKYHSGEGWVELDFWHKLVPHLMGLRVQFTSYKLQQAHALRSTYSWKLLELLMRFASTGQGWANYDLDDFKASMNVPPSLQEDFGQIKRRVIEPAVKELTNKDGWTIRWHPVKTGKKVTALQFEFEHNPPHAEPLQAAE